MDCQCIGTVQIYDSIISAMSQFVMGVIAVIGFVMAVNEYCRMRRETSKDRLNEKRRQMAKEIYGYYYEEQVALQMMEELQHQSSSISKMKKSELRKELKKRTKELSANSLETIPSMTPSQVKDYI